MRTEQISRGVVVYQKERSDLEQEALLTLARRQAEALPDEAAAEVGAGEELSGWRTNL